MAQIKTLDCGSQRLNDFRKIAKFRELSSASDDFPLAEQLAYPGLKLSTLQELFAFVECVDSDRRIMFNIESKVDADFPNLTRTVEDFVELQYAAFQSSSYLHQITVGHDATVFRLSYKKIVSKFRLENPDCDEGISP